MFADASLVKFDTANAKQNILVHVDIGFFQSSTSTYSCELVLYMYENMYADTKEIKMATELSILCNWVAMLFVLFDIVTARHNQMLK